MSEKQKYRLGKYQARIKALAYDFKDSFFYFLKYLGRTIIQLLGLLVLLFLIGGEYLAIYIKKAGKKNETRQKKKKKDDYLSSNNDLKW